MLRLKIAQAASAHGGNIYYSHLDSPIGIIHLAVYDKCICKVSLGFSAASDFKNYFSFLHAFKLIDSHPSTKPFKEMILSYLEKGVPLNDAEVAILRGTEFQKSVWRAALNIPYGKTRSYGWIAEKIKKPDASRAVGNALGENPVPLFIPCHRVVRSDGAMGGFTGGCNIKERLLSIEARGIYSDNGI